MKPATVCVLAEKVANATRKTDVVEVILIRTEGVANCCPTLVCAVESCITDSCGKVGRVADVVLIPLVHTVDVVVAAATNWQIPVTSQSPAVNERVPAFCAVPLVIPVALVWFVRYSPTLPAFALSLVVVPTMPLVLDGVIAPVAVRVDTVFPNAGSAPVTPISI